MTAIRDRLIALGGYVVEPLRSVRRAVAFAIAELDASDLQAVVAVAVYLALGTVVVLWATSMFVLVRWVVGA